MSKASPPMSPGILAVFLHYWMCKEPYRGPANEAFHMDAKQFLVALGLLDRADFPNVTPMGDAYAQMIMGTPLPVNRWIDPRKKDPDHG